jgi:stringent starvation protein B
VTASLRNAEKRRLFEQLLDHGIATLHLDPRKPDVQVPQKFVAQDMLLLNFSYRYNLADFRFDDREVVGTLTFQGAPFRCVVPWTAVFAMTNPAREGLVWEEDLPPEVRVAAQTEADDAQSGTNKPRAKAQPRLRSVQAAAESVDAPAEPALAATPKRHLGALPQPKREPGPQAVPNAMPRPGLQVLDGGQDDGPRPGPTRKSHLRRIK